MRPDEQSGQIPDEHVDGPPGGVSRRGFMTSAGVVATIATTTTDADAAAAATGTAGAAAGENLVVIRVRVNGTERRLQVDPRVTLLDTLRERLELIGSKKGCDRGQCGACTVHVDGRSVLSCLTLAVSVDQQQVTTVEGLSDGDRLHPLQQAFIDRDAFQCGFCTSGQIMAGAALVDAGGATDPAAISEAMSGNICRCGAYVSIVQAVADAAEVAG